MQRRTLLAMALTSPGAFALSRAARAQLGDTPIRIVFPFAAGSVGDTFARLLAERMRGQLDRTVIVENRTGAGGRIGVQAVRAAAADGSTLLFTPIAPISVYPHSYAALGYDPFADFAPVSQVATVDMALAVGSSIPARTLAELIVWLRANPAKANYATPGAGTLPHFLGVLLARATGIEMVHAPARGSAPALADVAAGHLPIILTSTNELVAPHRDGRVRVLATSGKSRSVFLPDVPTFNELGIEIVATGWFGFYVPAKTPASVIARLNSAIVTALKTQDVLDRLKVFGLEPTGTTPEEFGRIARADFEQWGPIVKASGFTSEQ